LGPPRSSGELLQPPGDSAGWGAPVGLGDTVLGRGCWRGRDGGVSPGGGSAMAGTLCGRKGELGLDGAGTAVVPPGAGGVVLGRAPQLSAVPGGRVHRVEPCAWLRGLRGPGRVAEGRDRSWGLLETRSRGCGCRRLQAVPLGAGGGAKLPAGRGSAWQLDARWDGRPGGCPTVGGTAGPGGMLGADGDVA